MLDLGFRTHDFGRKFDNADQIGEIVSSYRKNACLHFAPYKVLDNAPKPMNTTWADDTRKALDSHGVRVAILGCYVNPVHPDPDILEQELQKFENGLDVAESLGAGMVATETGSLDARNIRCEETWTDKNWTRFLNIVEHLLKKAEKNNVIMALEAVADKNTIDDPVRMFRVMENFKSPNLRCLFDAVNILPIKGVDDFASWYDEAVSMLAPYIRAMHLKDYVWADSMPGYPYAKGPVKKGNIAIGEGIFPWKTVFGIYKKYGVDNVPMTLENFRPDTLKASLEYIEKTYAEA
ncbi:MAG: sugar phosphate isomerase/epimerase [Spirochaetales bacterium]|nr:sugar phosphate isomerase/epimerase [Spirochaetales bacterium]